MYFRLLFVALVALGLAGTASAQNTAQPVITGYLTTSGCPSTALTPCFVQYGAGGASTVTIGAPLGPQTGAASIAVICNSGCSGGPSDESAFTAGTSSITTGGFFQTTATSNPLTNGQAGSVQLTANRAFMVNLRNAAGAESGVAAVPLQVSLANTAANGTAVAVNDSTGNASLATIATNTGAAVPAGSAIIGKVGIDQTTPGTTNGVDPVITNVAPATQNVTAQDVASTSTTVANNQVFVTGAPTANSAASFALANGYGAVRLLVTGTWTGTLSQEYSMDSGTTWTSMAIHMPGTSYTSVNLTANYTGYANVAGITNVRVRATAAWTGTATVKIVQTVSEDAVAIINPMTLRDPTTQSISNTIKAASTAPVGGDTALVVALSPNGAQATAANQTGVQGTVGAGTAPASMNVSGCQYNATIPAATDTQSLALNCDPAGRLRVNAQPATQSFVTGVATQTGTTSTSLIGMVASNRIYMTAFSCYNSGASASVVLFQDGSAGTTIWSTIVPAGGGSNIDGNTALARTTSGNALYFAPQTSSTTVGCSAAGFSGP